MGLCRAVRYFRVSSCTAAARAPELRLRRHMWVLSICKVCTLAVGAGRCMSIERMSTACKPFKMHCDNCTVTILEELLLHGTDVYLLHAGFHLLRCSKRTHTAQTRMWTCTSSRVPATPQPLVNIWWLASCIVMPWLLLAVLLQMAQRTVYHAPGNMCRMSRPRACCSTLQ